MVNQFNILSLVILAASVPMYTNANTQKWSDVGEMLMSKSYVDMASVRESINHRQYIAYTNKMVSKSDNSGIPKGGYVISDVIDNCENHEQQVFNIHIHDADGRVLTSSYGGGEPLDTQLLKNNSAQYLAHYKLCQDLINTKKKAVVTGDPESKAAAPVDAASTPVPAITPVTPVVTEVSTLDVDEPEVKAVEELPNQSIKMTETAPKGEAWEFVAESKSMKAEIDRNAYVFNSETQRASYAVRYTLTSNKNNMFKTGEVMISRAVADCKNNTTMRLAAVQLDVNGKELSRKQYSGKNATFETVNQNSLAGAVQNYVCRMK